MDNQAFIVINLIRVLLVTSFTFSLAIENSTCVIYDFRNIRIQHKNVVGNSANLQYV